MFARFRLDIENLMSPAMSRFSSIYFVETRFCIHKDKCQKQLASQAACVEKEAANVSSELDAV